ncbi:MAG TPA: phasin family protein [Methylocella sp.]|nr:phasin family protein [Methylocella sp.]
MAQHDERTSLAGPNSTASVFDNAMNTITATSKNIQAIAGEIVEISKQSLEHTTQTLEKLRHARGIDEVVAIQTNFVKESFERASRHAQKFGELMTAYPAEMTKICQDAWLKSLNSTVKATETASQTAAENIERFSETAKKTSNIFDHRESA